MNTRREAKTAELAAAEAAVLVDASKVQELKATVMVLKAEQVRLLSCMPVETSSARWT